MRHFSEEYLEKLVAEHKLKSASLARLKGPAFSEIARVHSTRTVNVAIEDLAKDKVILEAQIDVLSEYLRG